MPTRSSPEWCPHCDRETEHRVRISVLTESRKSENAKFAREPYRISTCERCGIERTKRMSSA